MLRTVYSIILCFLFSALAVAQGEKSYLFKNRLLEKAAPIFCVEQTKDGLLWLGTQNGLYSYDGYRFVSHVAGNSPTMIYCQLAVGDQIYLGCENGIALYDSKKECYLPFKGTQLKGVRTMLRQGNIIYIGTVKGLFAYDIQFHSLKLLNKDCKRIFSLATTSKGILIGTLNGLYEYKLDECKSLKYFPVLRGKPISAVKYDAVHQLYWIGTFEGLFSLKFNTNGVDVKKLTGSMVVKSLEIIHDKLLLCSDDGLYVYQEGKLSQYLHNSQNPFSLGNDVVWDAFSNHNQVFLGTDEGLTAFNLSPIYNYFAINALTSGMSIGNNLEHILIDKNKQMWLGGTGGCIRVGNDFVWYRQHDSKNVLSHNHVRKVYEDKGGKIWISTDNGLNLYDPSTKCMSKKMIYDKKEMHNVPWIYDMIEDTKGRLWVGTCDNGIYVVNKEKLVRSTYLCQADIHLLDKAATQLLLDAKGRIWARMRNGIQMIDTNKLTIKTITRTPASKMIIDHDGYVWTANESSLTCYKPNGEKREEICFDSALKIPSIVDLLEIDGDIWVFTPSLCSIYGKKGWSKTLKLPFLQARCVYYDKSKEMVFVGGKDAFMSFSPQKVKNEEENLRLQLSAVKVNGMPYRHDGEQLCSLSQIILKSNENNFSLALTDLPLLTETSALYAYQLEGLETSWHYLQTAKDEISYNGLPYGDYNLQVCMVNGFGKIGKQLYSITIKVLPPWYLSVFAKAVYLLIFVLLVYGLVKSYITRMKLKMEHIEKIRIKDDLDMRIQFYNNLAKRLYQGVSNLMCRIVLLSKNGMLKDNLKEVNEFRFETTKLNAVIRESLDLGDLLTEEKFEEKILSLDIVSSFRTSLMGFQKEALQKNIKLIMETDGSMFMWQESPIKWDKFTYILLRSMIDYSQQGSTVNLKLSKNLAQQQMTITVSCDKFLVNDEDLPAFFHRYANIKLNDAEKRTLDMYFIKEYVENKLGSIQIQKDESNRVLFLLSMPIINEEQATKTTSVHKEMVMPSYQDEKFLKMVTNAIKENMGDSDFNVTRLQNVLGIGRKLLYRKVKQMTSMSPVEYIRYIRLKQAAMLLSQGRFAISEVMYVVGFSNSGYFSKCFQHEFGMTPTAYVKSHTEQNN